MEIEWVQFTQVYLYLFQMNWLASSSRWIYVVLQVCTALLHTAAASTFRHVLYLELSFSVPGGYFQSDWNCVFLVEKSTLKEPPLLLFWLVTISTFLNYNGLSRNKIPPILITDCQVVH